MKSTSVLSALALAVVGRSVTGRYWCARGCWRGRDRCRSRWRFFRRRQHNQHAVDRL